MPAHNREAAARFFLRARQQRGTFLSSGSTTARSASTSWMVCRFQHEVRGPPAARASLLYWTCFEARWPYSCAALERGARGLAMERTPSFLEAKCRPSTTLPHTNIPTCDDGWPGIHAGRSTSRRPRLLAQCRGRLLRQAAARTLSGSAVQTNNSGFLLVSATKRLIAAAGQEGIGTRPS